MVEIIDNHRGLLALKRLLCLYAAIVFTVIPAISAQTIKPCQHTDLSLGTDDENGAFNGMSHSGTLLVLRNLGTKACTVQPIPHLTFFAGNVPLAIVADLPGSKFMHPGPVVLPVTLAPEAEATAKIRWISNPVFQDNLCVEPTRISIAIEGGQQSAPLKATICGERAQGVHLEINRLRLDPVAPR